MQFRDLPLQGRNPEETAEIGENQTVIAKSLPIQVTKKKNSHKSLFLSHVRFQAVVGCGWTMWSFRNSSPFQVDKFQSASYHFIAYKPHIHLT